MVKKLFLLFMFFLFVFLASGCGTLRGAKDGFMQEDMKVVEEWDAWIRKNLW